MENSFSQDNGFLASPLGGRGSSPKSILVTGASGTVGLEVLYRLVAANNYRIYAFDLHNKHSERLFAPLAGKIEVIYGNITKHRDIAKIPAGMDVIIHLAAIIPPMADKHPHLTHEINVNGTRNLIRHLETFSPDCHFLFSSSVAVYGDRILDPEIRVTDPLHSSEGDMYAESKILCEEMIRHSKLNWTIFRLTAIMKNHKISPLMFHMPLSTMMEIATPRDVAKAFAAAALHLDELVHRVFNLGGGKPCLTTYREFIDRSFRLYGLGKLNFPKHAFAEKNFHCGIFADGDELENLLHFRSDTLKTYFASVKNSIPRWQHLLATLFRLPVKGYLLLQSEPYRAYRTHNIRLMRHFFFTQPQTIPVS